jgi:ABC-type glycerol-3-phosphate transport system substrate-binding protein
MENLSVASQLADTDIPYVSAQMGDIEEVAVQAVLMGELSVQEAIKQMEEQFRATVDSVRSQL